MSSNTEPTLAAGLRIEEQPLRDHLAEAARTCTRLDTQARTGAFLAPRFWHHVGDDLEKLVVDQVDRLTIPNVLARGWVDAKELLEYTDPTRHPPGERNVVALGRGSTSHSWDIAVDLTVNGTKVAKALALVLTAQLEVEGLQLGIVDGCVESVACGKLALSGSLECEEKTLTNFPLRKIDLPGEHHFEHPIPITPHDRYAESLAPA
jgi:hypothetical protein